MDLGPGCVEHVAGLRLQGVPLAVPKLVNTLYNYTDNEFPRVIEPLEMLALVHCIAALVRRYTCCQKPQSNEPSAQSSMPCCKHAVWVRGQGTMVENVYQHSGHACIALCWAHIACALLLGVLRDSKPEL